jgi:hypothetical protein
VLNCIYQVRCNFFHGGKHQDDERDRNLVAAGFVIMLNLTGMHMNGRAYGGWQMTSNSQSVQACRMSWRGCWDEVQDKKQRPYAISRLRPARTYMFKV